jgi:antitoxin StbD
MADDDDRAGPGYVFAVWPLNEIRGSFPAILDRFADEGPLSPPVIVGRHRKPEAAVVPYRLLARLLAVYEERRGPQAAADAMAERAGSGAVEFTTLDGLAWP